MPSWVQHPITGKLIPRDEYQRPVQAEYSVFTSPDPFVSPIDKSVISDRSHLREHNKRHGVTDFRDYGSNYFERKAKERDAALHGKTPEAKKERIEAIKRSMYYMEHGNGSRK